MARTVAKTTVSIWNQDADFVTVPAPAQRLYWLLLSQSRLNLAGAIELRIRVWASLAPDTTEADIRAALGVLEERRYIVIDWHTEELVVRTFTIHDLCQGALNINLIKGFWAAWTGIMSAQLRKVVVDHLPDMIWDSKKMSPPAAAAEMRRSPRLEPQLQLAVGTDSVNGSPDYQTEPSISVSSSVSVTAATGGSDREPATTDPAPSHGGGPDIDQALDDAARLLAEAEADRRGTAIANRPGYIRARLSPLRQQHELAWRRLLEADPTLTAEQLAQPTTANRGHDHDRRPDIPDAATVMADALPDPDELATTDHTLALANARAALAARETTDP